MPTLYLTLGFSQRGKQCYFSIKNLVLSLSLFEIIQAGNKHAMNELHNYTVRCSLEVWKKSEKIKMLDKTCQRRQILSLTPYLLALQNDQTGASQILSIQEYKGGKLVNQISNQAKAVSKIYSQILL